MSALSWSTLLFALKWVLIGLIYFALLILLLAVRRELGQRIGSGAPAPAVAAGQLRVLQPGGDPRFAPGSLLGLQPVTTLGAEQDNDLVLQDPYVSGHHARLRWDGVAWWVEDLGSRNGTFVNRQRCQPHMPRVVPAGGVVQLGNMTFELLD
jgi:hypothetical protein